MKMTFSEWKQVVHMEHEKDDEHEPPSTRQMLKNLGGYGGGDTVSFKVCYLT